MTDQSKAVGAAPGRLAHLDGLRGMACLLVIVTHSLQEVYWPSLPAGRFRFVVPFLMIAHYSVVLFIALSGYCLMLPVLSRGGLRGGARGFYLARARRILPAYYAAVVLALLVIGSGLWQADNRMDDISLGVGRRAILAKFLLIHNFWPEPFFGNAGNVAIASVFWTIAIESQIYLVFPAMLALRRRFGDHVAFGSIMVLSWVVFALLFRLSGARWGICIRGLWPEFYGMFAVGALAAASRTETPGRINWPACATLGLVGFLPLYYCGFCYGLIPTWALEAYCFPWFYTIFRACEHPGAWQKFFEWRPLMAVGTFSYSLYLLHLPILALLSRYALPLLVSRTRGTPWAFLTLLGLALATALPAAWAFAQIFEFPDRRRALAERLRSYWSPAVVSPPAD